MAISNLPEYTYNDNYKIPGAGTPQKNPYLDQIYQQQKSLSDDFRKNLGRYQDNYGNQYENQARNQLAQNMVQTKKDFNSRGLTYSGARQGKEASSRANTNYDISQQRYNINQQLAQQADQLENQANQSAYNAAGYAPQMGAGLLQGTQMNLNSDMAAQQALGSLIGGGANGLLSLLGGLYGKK